MIFPVRGATGAANDVESLLAHLPNYIFMNRKVSILLKGFGSWFGIKQLTLTDNAWCEVTCKTPNNCIVNIVFCVFVYFVMSAAIPFLVNKPNKTQQKREKVTENQKVFLHFILLDICNNKK